MSKFFYKTQYWQRALDTPQVKHVRLIFFAIIVGCGLCGCGKKHAREPQPKTDLEYNKRRADRKFAKLIDQCRIDCATISTSIKQYYDDYKRYPTRKGQKANTKGGDLTFDSVDLPNSDAIVILIDDTELSDVNKNHRANYKKTRYFKPKLVTGTDSHGVGSDGVFRDPWGNPYVITVDLNNDDKCSDLLYELPSISGIASERIGHHGLMRETINGEELFVLPGSVMVWSKGPDGKTDPTVSAEKGANRDNVIGWH